MTRYRILLVVRHPVGGIRTFFRYVYTHFDASKYEFAFIAPDIPETRVLLEDLRGLNLTPILLERTAGNKELFRQVTKTLRGGGFDLVHSHGFSSAVCSAVAAVASRVPHIVTCHDVFTENQFRGIRGLLKKVVLSVVLATTTCIHCVGNDARDNLFEYLRFLRLFKRKVVVIRNGIETGGFLQANSRNLKAELGLNDATFLIGFMGRFMSQKGFRYLVDAMEQILSKANLPRRPLVLAFGADGFIREDRTDIERRGLSDAIHFLPFVPDVAETLKGIDVVAMPSLWEACGLLAMESMVAGTPLIGTNCIGLREVLSDTPARVVPTADSEALAAALMSEMTNPSTKSAKSFSEEAAARFQVTDRAQELEQLVLRLLEGQFPQPVTAHTSPD